MNWLRDGSILLVCLLIRLSVVAQSAATDADTVRPIMERPAHPTFIAEADQRFFFFGDSRNVRNRPVPVNVWGARAGFLFPAAFKLGVGLYFANQRISQPGLLPEAPASVNRQLRYLTAYWEPFFYRKKHWELSALTELGWGYSRYQRTDDPTDAPEVARGNFMPGGVGVSFAVKLPALRGFRPLRWLGVNFLTGYRFILKKDIPSSKINYNGFYYSIGPAFFLDRFTADVKEWQKGRRMRRSSK